MQTNFVKLLLYVCCISMLSSCVVKKTTKLLGNQKSFSSVSYEFHNERILKIKDASVKEIETVIKELSHPERIRVLQLDSLNLKALPKNILKLSKLEHLSLVYNPKLNFDKELHQIENLPLVFLNLSSNKLTSIPKAIPNFKKLEDLNLSYNRIHKGADYEILAKLEKLSLLWLQHNQLDEIPPEIGTISGLKRLFLDHNNLKNLPDKLQQIKHLRVVHIGHNLIETYPVVFNKMRSLVLVHLNNNKISNLSKAYAKEKFCSKGLVLTDNPLDATEKKWIRKNFKNYFLLIL